MRILTISLLLVTAAACGRSSDPRRTNFEVKKDNVYAKYDSKSGRLKKIDADVNKNGTMETFSLWDGTRLEQIQIDQNEDGRIDRWEHYDAANKIVTVGTSSKDDGVEDTVSFVPDAEGSVRIDYDTDRDGQVERRETWTQVSAERRVMTRVESDFDASGAPGRRLTYRLDGTLEKDEPLR